jgi:hypothetical protein
MGLTPLANECFEYNDAIGGVVYKHLQTKDLVDVPLYSVFTKPPVGNIDLKYAGFVSDLYQFEGNEVMNNRIRQSILEVGVPIFREYVYLNPIRTRMSNEILIQNMSNIPKVGDVYPEVVVNNTYDGSGAREFLFGFSILENNTRVIGFGFKNKIGTIRQVHNIHARTSFSSPISQYVEFFSKNILDIVKCNFEMVVEEDHLLAVFDMLEKVGKKRRNEVSTYLAEMSKENEGKINTWNLFLAITYFSTIERNVNIKTLLDSIAEKVLVIPVEIQQVLNTLNKTV